MVSTSFRPIFVNNSESRKKTEENIKRMVHRHVRCYRWNETQFLGIQSELNQSKYNMNARFYLFKKWFSYFSLQKMIFLWSRDLCSSHVYLWSVSYFCLQRRRQWQGQAFFPPFSAHKTDGLRVRYSLCFSKRHGR